MISSCLGRKVWFQGDAPIYPNIYIIIVGPPAVGKSFPATKMCDMIRSLETLKPHHSIPGQVITEKLVNIVPQCLTLERLYQILAKSTTSFKWQGKPKLHSSVSFLLADEMGMLFKKNDKMSDLINFLIGGYDCMGRFEYETKHMANPDVILNMCVNFFGCTTPDWITQNINSSAINGGWASRVFFIYGDKKRQLTTYFKYTPEQLAALEEVKQHCRKVAGVVGEVTFSPEALEYFDYWYQKLGGGLEDGGPTRVNRDPKLDTYYNRKRVNTWKVAMNRHFMESLDLVVTIDDIKWAFKLEAEAELQMHKALASINTNPIAKLAEDILRQIKVKSGPLSFIEILNKHFNQAIGGTKAIQEAVLYLKMTQKIVESGKDSYVVGENIIRFPSGSEGGVSEVITNTEPIRKEV